MILFIQYIFWYRNDENIKFENLSKNDFGIDININVNDNIEDKDSNDEKYINFDVFYPKKRKEKEIIMIW